MRGFSLIFVCALTVAKAANSDPSQAPAICAAGGSDGILVASENCNQFYKCYRGVPVAIDCQPGLLYDPANEWCDFPDRVDCGIRVIPEEIGNGGGGSDGGNGSGSGDGGGNNGSGNSDPSQAPEICAAEGSDGVLVASENCNQFYKCYRGAPVAINCQPGLLYDPANEWCDYPDRVDCGSRLIPDEDGNGGGNGGEDSDSDSDDSSDSDSHSGSEEDGNDDPSEAAAICAKEGSDGVLVASEKCNQFYKCSDGNPVAVDCQPGLLYNPENEWCDWPANVDCGDRVIPSFIAPLNKHRSARYLVKF